MPGGIRSTGRVLETARLRPLWFVLLTLAVAADARSAYATEPNELVADAVVERFDKVIAPLLTQRCLDCHNKSAHKGGLDLSSGPTAFAGGDGGPVIVPGKVEESPLWQRIDAGEMPPEKPLPPAERELLKSWIEAGAKWGTEKIDPFRYTTERRAGLDWWSLQPLVSPGVPSVRRIDWPSGPVDAFILAALEKQNLNPAPPASRRVLIRRLYFDVIGLPPEPAEVEAFVADSSPRAYEDLVDRLLNSPAYGERWGRHWLDIVRFGESQGFERDKLRPNSWRYRDWVVHALNRDLPYDEFVRTQLAGDLLYPDDPVAVAATGFLVAAPWDEVGQSQQSAVMRAVVRQDELEDLVGTVGQTFMGLTVNCARCHDHKFDPISQVEYYRLAAALGGVQHGERECLLSTGEERATARQRELDQQLTVLNAQLASIDEPIRERLLQKHPEQAKPAGEPPRPIARWDFDSDYRDQIGSLHGTPQGGARLEGGSLRLDGMTSYVVTAPLEKDLDAKTLEVWVRLSDLSQGGGGVMTVQTLDGVTFDSVVFGEREPGKWLPGSNNYARTTDLEAKPETTADKELVHLAIVYDADQNITVYRNGQPYAKPYKSSGPISYAAGTAQVAFGIRHSPPGGNRLLAGVIDKAQLYDRALTAAEIAASADRIEKGYQPTEDEVLALLPTELRTKRNALVLAASELETERRLWTAGPAYAVVPRQPAIGHLLERGNPAAPKEVVTPGGVASLSTLSAEFQLPPDAPDAERRVKLAEWITDPRNPLTPRVICNRLWHYHFGGGLVDTPNDFGFNGGRPTHAPLLDWLAGELIRGKWSLKRLHRTLLLSSTYRQSSRFDPAAAKVDADNRLLWRMSPRRLEAEALRDAVLVVAGELNPRMGGPGYRDFKTFTRNTQFYEVFDAVGAEFNRRSLYRTWVRSGRNPLLDVLDCPDPSTAAPKRAVTTTPLQALALLNNAFMLRMADKLAHRIEASGAKDTEQQAARAYELAYARAADPEELAAAARFVSEHALPAFCRVVFNSNEFLYID